MIKCYRCYGTVLNMCCGNYVLSNCGKYLNKAIEMPAIIVNMLELVRPAELQPSLLLH